MRQRGGLTPAEWKRCTRGVVAHPREDDILRRGDASAVASLIDEHYGSMHRLARLVGRHPDAARKAVRAAWIAVLEAPDARPLETSLRGWLLRLVLEAIGARDASSEPQPVAPADDFEDPNGRWAGWWKDAQTKTPLPEVERLDRILATLPVALTVLLALRDVERLPAEEVEAIVGRPPDEQLRLLQHAHAAVRSALRAGEQA
jgi:DNA-directed RNA polymerase specialized sigma24 family protein